MLKVGLTGGTGSGKSTVAALLADHGAVVVDADLLAREVVAAGSDGLAAVTAEFGPGVLTEDGHLDRAALAAIVFADLEHRKTLEAITHPRIAARTAELIAEVPAGSVVVHDIPLLVEKKMSDQYDLIVVVHAPAEERVRRLVEHRGMSEDDAWQRVRAQASDEERRAVADVWLENHADEAALRDRVDRLWTELLEAERRQR